MEVWEDKTKGWCYQFKYQGKTYGEEGFRSRLDCESVGAVKHLKVLMGEVFTLESIESKKRPLFTDANDYVPGESIKKSDNLIETSPEKEQNLEEGLDSLETSTEDRQDSTENHPCEDELTPVRSFCKSEIWDRDPLYLKLLIWIIAQVDENGEVMTTCSKIQKDLSYFSNRKKTVPTLKQTRIILDWLQVQGYISKTQVRGGTKAYIGTQITLNYRSYQNLRSKDRGTSQTDNSGTQPGP